jgi:tetratricopeptide (TPR) repeat protein
LRDSTDDNLLLAVSAAPVASFPQEDAVLDLFAFREFREGLALLRDGEPEKALGLLRQASERDPENPYYLSYYGMSLAYAQGKWSDAERLCHTAACRARRQAQLHLNLAEIYAASGRKQAAADTLAKGLHYLPEDTRLQNELGRLATRRPPVLKFLPRAHVLNRTLGLMRHQLLSHVPRRRWLTVRESEA